MMPYSSESASTSLVQTRSKTRRSSSRGVEELEAWKDSGAAVALDSGIMNSSVLAGMSRSIDGKAFGDEIHSLCDSYQTRFVGTDGNIGMKDKIQDSFKKLGLQTWTEDLDATTGVQDYLRGDASKKFGGNVMGFLKGTDLAKEVVVVGAHYDSVNWEKKGGVSPGVDDNGSGSALVQLVARAFATSKVKPRRSMMFVGFNSEEEGLVGSEQMAAKAKNGDYGDIKAVLIADEVAYPGSGSGRRKAIFETVGAVPGTQSLVDTFAHNVVDA